MPLRLSIAILFAGSSLAGCTTLTAPFTREPTGSAPAQAAATGTSSPASVELAPAPVIAMAPIPDPEPAGARPQPIRRRVESGDPTARVASANEAARVGPTRDGYENAVQVYPYEEGALFQVYAAPGRITDIMLEPGEQLTGSGPVAAGDTVRWIIGDTVSGSGPSRRAHILVKPTAAGLATNLVVNTDRRTYHVELRSTPNAYMASVAWRYPASLAPQAATAAVSAEDLTPAPSEDSHLYTVSGPSVAWRPVRAWADGRQVFIEFADSVARDELPPLFVVGRFGRSELVNYRVRGRHMIVDRLFRTAELRLGEGGAEQRVRITQDQGGRS